MLSASLSPVLVAQSLHLDLNMLPSEPLDHELVLLAGGKSGPDRLPRPPRADAAVFRLRDAEETFFRDGIDPVGIDLESPLDLSFLGRAFICYVCEARYKGFCLDTSDEAYKEETARNARRSKATLHWKERAERYERQAG